MRVTLKQIAGRANLSMSTTSRALNGHPSVGQEMVAKVRRIATEMDYRPVRSHKRPSAASSHLAGRVVAIASLGLDQSLVSMPVISAGFRGAEESLRQAGAEVHYLHMPDCAELPHGFPLDRVDGLIITAAMVREFAEASNTPAMRQLKKLPSVWIFGQPPGAWGSAVVADDFAIGVGAAELLVSHGHRNLAFLNHVPDNLLFSLREDGFYSAARRLGAEVRSFCKSPPSGWPIPMQAPTAVFDTVQALTDELLDSTPRPTAVFATADSVAALVYCALGIRGLRVGHDLSVIGGNNTQGLLAVPYPHLATFDIHAQKIGEMAVRQLGHLFGERAANQAQGVQVAEIRSKVVIAPTPVPGQSVSDLTGAVI